MIACRCMGIRPIPVPYETPLYRSISSLLWRHANPLQNYPIEVEHIFLYVYIGLGGEKYCECLLSVSPKTKIHWNCPSSNLDRSIQNAAHYPWLTIPSRVEYVNILPLYFPFRLHRPLQQLHRIPSYLAWLVAVPLRNQSQSIPWPSLRP